MNWHEYIHTDPKILRGKPVVKGTRLSVEYILRLFAVGWNEQQVLENYPTLTVEAIHAVFAYAAACMRDEALHAIPLEPA
jgi:uncharacterized protein (DUF433 family)